MDIEGDAGLKENGLQSEIACTLPPDEGHQKKLLRYAEAKTRALKVSEHILSHYPQKIKIGSKINQCGTYLVFHHYYTVEAYRLGKSNFCRKHLFCGLCAILRAAKQLRAYLDKAEIVLSENPDLVLIFVTLTVKNGPDLMERFHHLQSNYRKLVQRRRDLLKSTGRNKKDTVFIHFQGAVTTYEFTRGDGSTLHPDTGWHPHIHMICAVKPSVDCELLTMQLKREWEDLTVDSHQCLAKPIDYENEDERIKAFVEVFKYPLKYNDMRVKDQVHAGFKLHKNRLIASFGLFYGVKDPEDLCDVIEEDLTLLPYVELIYGYSDKFGYQLKDQKHVDAIAYLPDLRKDQVRAIQLVHGKPESTELTSKFAAQVETYCDKVLLANDRS